MANQARLRSYRTSPKFKYGFEIPRNYSHALELDKRNGNTKWYEANNKELDTMYSYEVFEDRGLKGHIPQGFSATDFGVMART